MSLRVLGGVGAAPWQLKSYRAARSNPVGRGLCWRAYCVVPSSGERGEAKMEQQKEKKPQTETHADVMTGSFGEGYGTRSDEEGFGGVYGGNDPVLNPGHNVNHPEFDKSQGCEVKEKEKARNQPHGAHTA